MQAVEKKFEKKIHFRGFGHFVSCIPLFQSGSQSGDNFHICIIIHQFTSYSNDNLIPTWAKALTHHDPIKRTLYMALYVYVMYPLCANSHSTPFVSDCTHSSEHLHLFPNSCIVICYIITMDSVCLVYSSPKSLFLIQQCVCLPAGGTVRDSVVPWWSGRFPGCINVIINSYH